MNFSETLIERLRNARHVVVFSGAGVSAESGVPTFRDALTGLWAMYRAEDLATPSAFRADPKLVWDWYAWRREKVRQVSPNPAHHAIATMGDCVPKLTLVTQNVDGLHQRAGSSSVIELHGNISRVKCIGQGHLAEDWDDSEEQPPKCAVCGSLLRPDVVWFHESLPAGAFELANTAARDCDVFFSVGTSMLVYPAAELPYIAEEVGATIIQINPNMTSLNGVAHYNLTGKAGEILPALVQAAWHAWG
jgi:NAD-dependent deacetylase